MALRPFVEGEAHRRRRLSRPRHDDQSSVVAAAAMALSSVGVIPHALRLQTVRAA